MASWEGFSDEDLLKMKNERVPDGDKTFQEGNKVATKLKKATFQTTKKPLLREKIPSRKNSSESMPNQDVALPSLPQESKPLMNGNNVSPDKKCIDQVEIVTSNEYMDLSEFKFNTSSLEQFQLRQKIMEEQNAKRKDMLVKAIANKWKKTQGEVTKLAQIQKSLDHLDGILSNDVSILRNKIEEASRDYMEAQKKYNKVEKEFIEVKLELQKKTEHKDQLMGHLCTIIEQNELRKGKKLAELMEKLEMETSIEEIQQIENLPQVGILNAQSLPISPKTSKVIVVSDTSVLSSYESITSFNGLSSEIPNNNTQCDADIKNSSVQMSDQDKASGDTS